MYFSLPDCPCLPHCISILIWKDGFFCVALFACSQSLYLWSHNLVTKCTCISTWINDPISLFISAPFPWWQCYMETWESLCLALWICHHHYFSSHIWLLECVHASVHVLHVYLTPHICFNPISILTWNDGCPLCGTDCVSSICTLLVVPWSWIEGVHASVHVLLCTWLPISASPH